MPALRGDERAERPGRPRLVRAARGQVVAGRGVEARPRPSASSRARATVAARSAARARATAATPTSDSAPATTSDAVAAGCRRATRPARASGP
ncbi:MAG: hypothetical protein M9894_02215 [Planctomycetes bacterium]|nr:hypothetical protein [Planctomycetota bacterium]